MNARGRHCMAHQAVSVLVSQQRPGTSPPAQHCSWVPVFPCSALWESWDGCSETAASGYEVSTSLSRILCRDVGVKVVFVPPEPRMVLCSSLEQMQHCEPIWALPVAQPCSHRLAFVLESHPVGTALLVLRWHSSALGEALRKGHWDRAQWVLRGWMGLHLDCGFETGFA